MPEPLSPGLDYAAENLRSPRTRRLVAAMVFAVVLGAFITRAIHSLRPSGPSMGQPRFFCSTNERQLGMAIDFYIRSHGGSYPDSLAAALADCRAGVALAVCPSSNDSAAVLPPTRMPATTQQIAACFAIPGHLSYVYCGHADWTPASVPADAVVIYEPVANHRDGANFLFGGGQIQWIEMPRAAHLIAAASATTRPVSAGTIR